ncbi:MAG: hypothetical protein HZA90_22210 [Verrucomicrobia bacterium]|nr:hypothetical protein [Verrucomicrobiota bacterium]
MSVVAANLKLDPWTRILNHSRALAMATALRQAMKERGKWVAQATRPTERSGP